MNLLKSIFSSESKTPEKNEVEQDHEDKAVKITVPQPEIVESKIPEMKDEFNTFNVIKKNEDTEIYYRLQSQSSTEILRLNCTQYYYKFGDLRWTIPVEVRKDKFGHEQPYVEKEEKWHFIVRVFATSNGNYFYQFILSSGSCGYVIVDKKWVQQIMNCCETDSLKVFFSSKEDIYKYVPEPGTFDYKDFKSDSFKKNKIQLIDSYEIVNKEMYDSIIEVL